MDEKTASESKILHGHSGPVYGISFSPDRWAGAQGTASGQRNSLYRGTASITRNSLWTEEQTL